jgi:hypothetical protein
MRPVPQTFLLCLIVALCVLCSWQWQRETKLRQIAGQQAAELQRLKAERDEIESRVRAADAEILRLTGSLNELRGNSVAKHEHEEVLQANAAMRDAIAKQNALVMEQNAAITRANDAIQRGNETIKNLTAERDALAKRINEVTDKYNALAKKAGE